MCRIVGVSRSAYRKAKEPKTTNSSKPQLDEVLVQKIKALIERFPTYGYRRIWVWLRYKLGVTVSKKKVYRLMKLKGWMVRQRKNTPRPRVKKQRSRAQRSNQRWAMDLTHIYCGADGWAHLAAVIDCHDREIVGYEFALRGRANEAERALEAGCLERFGMVFPKGEQRPTLRSDNGLVFLSRRFRAACKQYGLKQEYITPYTPEQNGMIERFFRSLKEECVWQHNFAGFSEAQDAVRRWIAFYNEQRPHQSLGYLSPKEFREQPLKAA